MNFIFSYKRYTRPLQTPLVSSRGEWKERNGIIIRLINKHRKISYAEITPIDGFLTETLEVAESFCKSLGKRVAEKDIKSIPNTLPCCQFAFSSALSDLTPETSQTFNTEAKLTLSRFLPTNPIPSLKEYIKDGYTNFKYKIGIRAISDEIKTVEEICSYFPKGTFLRLDANGYLTQKQTERWLKITDQLSVELLEQPMPIDAIKEMLELSKKHRTPIALDESITHCHQLEQIEKIGWAGPVVIKPLIIGSREKFINWRKQTRLPIIYSSSFETSIGLQSALKLITTDNINSKRPIGFDTQKFFGEDIFNLHNPTPNLKALDNPTEKFGALWSQI